jgi:hypothetical protein
MNKFNLNKEYEDYNHFMETQGKLRTTSKNKKKRRE